MLTPNAVGLQIRQNDHHCHAPASHPSQTIFDDFTEVKMEVKMGVNSLRLWKLKWTIPYRLSASKAIVLHAGLNFQPAKQA